MIIIIIIIIIMTSEACTHNDTVGLQEGGQRVSIITRATSVLTAHSPVLVSRLHLHCAVLLLHCTALAAHFGPRSISIFDLVEENKVATRAPIGLKRPPFARRSSSLAHELLGTRLEAGERDGDWLHLAPLGSIWLHFCRITVSRSLGGHASSAKWPENGPKQSLP